MTRIVVINQHGSNRGDEAACRGMIHGLREAVPGCEIDIFCMYPLDIESDAHVRLHPCVELRDGSTAKQAARALFGLFRIAAGIGMPENMARLASALRKADLVISAPGGPYIGDIYSYTELEVMFHIFAARMLGKPYMIYAPSMGPFARKKRNRFRRSILSRAAAITLREDRSVAMVAEQLGITVPQDRITCDSALQKPVAPPAERLGTFKAACEGAVGFIPIETERFATQDQRDAYVAMITGIMDRIHADLDRDIVMFPQGYAKWRDLPFFEKLRDATKHPERVTVFPETINSDDQQSLIGGLEGMVSFRYHPGIFAVRQGVPTLSVAYEHKAKGFMAAAGLSEFCVDLDTVTADQVIDGLRRAMSQKEELSQTLSARLSPLEALSRKNSEVAATLLHP